MEKQFDYRAVDEILGRYPQNELRQSRCSRIYKSVITICRRRYFLMLQTLSV